MKCTVLSILLVVLVTVGARRLPIKDNLMVDMGNEDTAVVESTIREIRAAYPDQEGSGAKVAYVHRYGDLDGKDNVEGYLTRSSDGGNDGYRHYDSYHKKDGDKYGYETHTAFGKGQKASSGATGSNTQYKDKGAYQRSKNSNDDDEDGEESKNTYKVVEDTNENEGAADESGESGGHYSEYGSSSGSGGSKSSGSYSDGSNESGNYAKEGGYDSGDESGGNYSKSSGDGGSESYSYASSEGGEEGDGGESGKYTEAEAEEEY